MILKNDKIEFKALTRHGALTFGSYSQAERWALTQNETVWVDLVAVSPCGMSSLKSPISKIKAGRIEMIHAFYLDLIPEVSR